MEIILLLLIIALLWSNRSFINNKNQQLLSEIHKLRDEFQALKKSLEHTSKPANDIAAPKESSTAESQNLENKAPIEKPIIVKERFTPPAPVFEAANSIANVTDEPAIDKEILKPLEQVSATIPNAKKTEDWPTMSGKEAKKSFMEKYPDLEKFIGENLVNKIGIAILVLGIGYFVKFAIDKNWINEIGRVAIGILCGGILIGLAHMLRKEFQAFSSVLVGGGIAVLYFTISLAFHDYHLFSQTLAFGMMVVITAFAVILSIAYNKVELAVLAIIGGFGSPFFVSTGQGNHVVLFSYLLILNGGMLSLAYFKKWNLVSIICYAFTVLIFGGWLFSKFHAEMHSPVIVFLFALAFYAVFFAMNIVYNLKNNLPFKTVELSLLLSNTFLFFSTGLYLLNSPNLNDYKGFFTVVMGLFNLGFAYPLYKRGDTDKNLIFLLIGLVLTFISLAAPIQLKGHNITLFWAAETVLLLWLSQKSGIMLIKQTSMLLTAMLLISLFVDWSKMYAGNNIYLIPVVNKAFVTGAFSVAALLVKLRLLKNENNTTFSKAFVTLKEYRILIQSIIIVLLYFTLFLEINHQTQYFYKNSNVRNIVILCYHFTYILLLLMLFKKYHDAGIHKVKITLLAVSIVLLFAGNISIIEVRNEIVKLNSPLSVFFFLHLYVMVLGFYFIRELHESLKTQFDYDTYKLRYIYWLSCILLITVACMELDHLAVYLLCDKKTEVAYILNQNHKFGYAILWGILAFALINIGLRRKIRELRIISLSLFTLVVIKLFVYDINNISEAGRIVAFVLLGVLLLVVSFMYQRLKKLLRSDNEIHASQNSNENEKL